MKIPSLGTVEGLAILGVGVFVAYVVYKSYKAGEGIVTSVKDTVMGVVHEGDLLAQKARTSFNGGDFGKGDDPYANETAKLKRYEQDAAWADVVRGTTDDVTPYNAMGDFNLGYYDNSESIPQYYSPSAVGDTA